MMDLFGSLGLYGPHLGHPTALGALGCPLNGQLQASTAAVAAFQAQAWNADYQRMVEKFKREAFYRSCSRHWLNAMLDIELGPT